MDTSLIHGNVFEDEIGTITKCNYCCEIFMDFDSFLKHISTIHCGTNITDLSEKILEKIFKFLTPNDLVNVKALCPKFKIIAEKVFYLHCDPGPIEFFWEVDKNRKKGTKKNRSLILPKCKSRYEACFTSFIRRVTMIGIISMPKKGANEFKFIRQTCAKNLVSLICYGDITVASRIIKGKIIRDQIENLKYLQLVNVPMKNLHEHLLQYTKHLKSLHILCICGGLRIGCFACNNKTSLHFDNEWTYHSYPELEWIYLQIQDHTFDLMPMIHSNPNLRNIACNSFSTIRSICRTEIELNCVAMIFLKYDAIDEFASDIINFGQRRNFQKFELSFRNQSEPFMAEYEDEVNVQIVHEAGVPDVDEAVVEVENEGEVQDENRVRVEAENEAIDVNEHVEDKLISRIVDVPNVTALHCLLSLVMRFIQNGVQLPLIEKLCIYIYGDDVGKDVRKIDKCFPNFRELRFRMISDAQTPVVGYSKVYILSILECPPIFRNLKQIHFENDESAEFSMDDVIEWNRSRSYQGDSARITVYLDPVVFHKFNENIIEMEKIVIKPWLKGCCEVCLHPSYSVYPKY